jgi:hypothetical protein
MNLMRQLRETSRCNRSEPSLGFRISFATVFL